MTSSASVLGGPSYSLGRSITAPASVWRGLGQAIQRQLRHAGNIGRLGQFEGQPAELGRRAADLGNARLFDLTRLKEAGLALAVSDLGRPDVVNDAIRFVNHRAEAVGHRTAIADDGAGIGKGVGQRVHEDQL